MRPCRYWAQYRSCKNGDRCPYQHDKGESRAPPVSSTPAEAEYWTPATPTYEEQPPTPLYQPAPTARHPTASPVPLNPAASRVRGPASGGAPYWSPGTRVPTPIVSAPADNPATSDAVRSLSLGLEHLSTGGSESPFLASAAPFTPTSGAAASTRGMPSAEAPEFYPSASIGAAGGAVAGEVAGGGGGGLVPVERDGCVYFVNEADAAGKSPAGPAPVDLMTDPIVRPAPRKRTWRSMFIPDDLYAHYQHQTSALLAQMSPDDARYKEIPPEYTCVVPLDSESTHRGTTGSLGYVTSVYKVVSNVDGMSYALRRCDNVRVDHRLAPRVLQAWSNVNHPNVVCLRNCFVSMKALFFAHDYYPGATAVRKKILETRGGLIPEATLWSYAVQLASGIRAIHAAGLSLRGIHPNRVLFTGHHRLRLAGAGVQDVLEADNKTPLEELQQADILGLGQVLLQIACRSTAALQNVKKSLNTVGSNYSPDFRTFLLILITKAPPIHEVCTMIVPQLGHELDRLYSHSDALDSVLYHECQNGRLLRTLIKLGMINERPEYEGDASWSETGDRYLLKLFRDMVFHQVDSSGRPMLDVSHVIECLLKLDCKDPERVLLSSRDESSLLVSSFSDISDLVQESYRELSQRKHGDPIPHDGSSSRGRGRTRVTHSHGRGAWRGRGGGGGGRGRGGAQRGGPPREPVYHPSGGMMTSGGLFVPPPAGAPTVPMGPMGPMGEGGVPAPSYDMSMMGGDHVPMGYY